MSLGEFRQHLVDAHGIKDHQGTRSLRMHVDHADYYMSIYNWTIHGVSATEESIRPRRGGWIA